MNEQTQRVNPHSKRPPVRYLGGKWALAPWIIGFFPPHAHYVEPFCGGASMLFRKHASEIETINDLDEEVVNFFRMLRERPRELLRAVALTPYARRELVIACGPLADDPVERARRFLVRSRMAYGSRQRHNTGWRYITHSHGRGPRLAREWADPRGLEFAVKRLRQVQIECDDAIAVIRRYDTPKTLFYVDPPYVLSSRSETRQMYMHEMTDDQHRELADLLNGVRGMVVLSGYRSALYDDLYAGWPRFDRVVPNNGNSTSVECVWVSPRAAHLTNMPLFSLMEATGD